MTNTSKLVLPTRWFVVYAPDEDGKWHARTAGGNAGMIAAQAKGIAAKFGKCCVVSVKYKKLRIVRGKGTLVAVPGKRGGMAKKVKTPRTHAQGLTKAAVAGSIIAGV